MKRRVLQKKNKAPPPTELKSIIMKQKASGAWEFSDVSSLLVRLDAEKIKSNIPKLEISITGDIEILWIAAVVAAYIAKVFPSEQNNWQQVVNKTYRFIAKQKKALSIKPDLDWKQEAEKFVNANLK